MDSDDLGGLDSVSGRNDVPLEPFVHQVGGRFPMVCLRQETICKPLNEREHLFYLTLPDPLKPYTPRFEGVMKVKVEEDQMGYITLTGTPPRSLGGRDSKAADILLLHHCGDENFGKNKRKDSLEIEKATPTDTPERTRSARMALLHENLNFEAVEAAKLELQVESEEDDEIFCNPWALKCHRDHLKKLGILGATPSSSSSPNHGGGGAQLYLLLENLVCKYKHPCVLDLKIGMRQFADDASAAKRARKNAKAANTTSASLGLRLCGMQVYQESSGKYICHNKYYGRTLSAQGFRGAIRFFLSSTKSAESEAKEEEAILRLDVVDCLVDKVQRLQSVLCKLDSYRFYTSSLLVTYDGNNESCEPADMRIIDFAHSTHKGLKDTVLHQGPDGGFLHGLKNFLAILKDIQAPKNEANETDSTLNLPVYESLYTA